MHQTAKQKPRKLRQRSFNFYYKIADRFELFTSSSSENSTWEGYVDYEFQYQ